MKRVRLPDPKGRIAAVRNGMSPDCSVRKSPLCDAIIGLYLTGTSFSQIELWLIQQGEIYRIPAPTLWRNLSKGDKNNERDKFQTHIENEIESVGGMVNLSAVNEAQNNYLLQKKRVDFLVRAEQEKRKEPGRENYHDKRLAVEQKILNELLLTYQKASGGGLLSRDEEGVTNPDGLSLSEDARKVLSDMILNEELKVDPSALRLVKPNS